ncbi:MAG: UDP-3-O-(3-hydroxymyristoyl)glucosamine N-acyltransferase, partial [Prevotella sp.]|nr:UDP-3-O-(3-hydroxymyristoyl)glucosamine N-acyltransferase [Prevotella sp.]
ARVNSFAKIEEGRPGAISFLSNTKYTHYIYDTQSSVVLIDENVELEHEVKATLIRVKNAYEAVARLLQAYESMKPKKKGIDPLAFIASSATLGDDCYVGAFAYIGEGAKIGKNCQIYPHAVVGENVSVGDDCIIYPNAVVYHDCRIGSRVTLHAGSVVGADGFGFAPTTDGYDKIPQIGIVTIEDDVEIGANTCIDRSTMGSTYVRKGVKLDNLVQIAHNTDIGANTVMSAQVGVAGSTKIGEWCMFGGQVGIAGHITIGNRVNLGAQSGAPSSIEDNQTLIGTPPMETRPFFRSQSIFRRLPDMYKELEELKKEVEKLKMKSEES